MKRTRSLTHRYLFLALLLVIGLAACSRDQDETTPAISPSPTSSAQASPITEVTPQFQGAVNFITVVTDAPSRFRKFEDIDQFGNVVGFDPDVMAYLAAEGGFEYEFVVTGFSGMLESIAAGDFDIAMSALTNSDQLPDGLVYTDPYLEVGQVLLVRANEAVIQGLQDLRVGMPVGAQRFSYGEQVARGLINLTQPDLQLYDTTASAVQALIDRQVEAVILDSDNGEYFVTSYPQQLKIAGGVGREAWITTKSYGIAVPEDNTVLLDILNQAIAKAHEDGTIERLARAWLVTSEMIDAGESLIGTPANELVIGIAGQLSDLDPARVPDLIGWELLINTMGGLLMYDADNNLVPILAADFPIISEDGLEVTVALRSGLSFPDGSDFSAEDVKFSINRAARLGNFQVNEYLKDEDEDNFADEDAIQIVDPLTIKFILKEPTSFFFSLLATPPYFIVSQDCYSSEPEPALSCGGIGPYEVTEWDPGEQMRLKAYPGWPGLSPAFENIQIRFYADPANMRRSLENSAIDIAWTGLGLAEKQAFKDDPAFTFWEGTSAFKSYLVFNHAESPWDNSQARQAIAYAIDRASIAESVFENSRKPLSSPVPDTTPGHVSSEPGRDLEQARALLTLAGYNESRKAEMTIWYIDDGRYTDLEDEYAAALESQIEETGMIEVTIQGAPWEVFRPQSLSCNYPAFLLGWPSTDQPPAYLEAMSWLEYFVTDTDTVCSNYESQAMDALLMEAREENSETERLDIYRRIQELWAEDLPTLDLTQEPRVAVTLHGVSNVITDGMGLLHYDMLTKTGG